MKDHHLRGLIAAVYTPLYSDGALNLDEVPRMIEHLVSSGVSGIYICGSTGEGMSLSTEERRVVAEAFVASAAGTLKTIVQVGHNSLAEAQELARHSQEIGADALSATAPSYYKLDSLELLVESMARIASGAPQLPFYYYHMPALTNASFNMEAFLKLAEAKIPNLAGMKYTAPMVHEYLSCRAALDSQFDVVWGTDEMLLSALVVGAQCAIGSTYNIAAPLNRALINAFESGDLERARQLQSVSVSLVSVLLRYPFHSAVKCVLSRMGIRCGPCRLPLATLTDQQERQLFDDIASSGLEPWLFDASSPTHNGDSQGRGHGVSPPVHVSQLAKKAN